MVCSSWKKYLLYKQILEICQILPTTDCQKCIKSVHSTFTYHSVTNDVIFVSLP